MGNWLIVLNYTEIAVVDINIKTYILKMKKVEMVYLRITEYVVLAWWQSVEG